MGKRISGTGSSGAETQQ